VSLVACAEITLRPSTSRKSHKCQARVRRAPDGNWFHHTGRDRNVGTFCSC
jgi:hypothetical protein